MSFVDGWSANNGSQCERACDITLLRFILYLVFSLLLFLHICVFALIKRFLADGIKKIISGKCDCDILASEQCDTRWQNTDIIFDSFFLFFCEWERETLSAIWLTYFRFSFDEINKYSFLLQTFEPCTLASGFWFNALDHSFTQWLTAAQLAVSMLIRSFHIFTKCHIQFYLISGYFLHQCEPFSLLISSFFFHF